MISEAEFVIASVTEKSDLFTELGYDSLTFVCLLLEIEKAFEIEFELTEMAMCSKADALIATVIRKIGEK